MNFAAFLLLVAAATASRLSPNDATQRGDVTPRPQLRTDLPIEEFLDWTVRHNRTYEADSVEWRQRFAIWMENLRIVKEHNARHDTHKLAMNELSDKTPAELHVRNGGLRIPTPSTPKLGTAPVDISDLPRRVDWRQRGVVTPVKYQGDCNCCWAISTVGSIEGLRAIMGLPLESLSAQELVDCDSTNDGCNGGFMETAFDWIVQDGGLDTAADYVFARKEQTCDAIKAARNVAKIGGFKRVDAHETHLLRAIAKQPVAVAVNAEDTGFAFYGEGILDSYCSVDVTHAVLAVGYDLDAGYILIKNSWGEGWGEGGYVRLAMGRNNGQGQCGVALLASYPVAAPQESGVQMCDSESYCATGQQCCCLESDGSACNVWGCCAEETDTCCADMQYCCPREYPICGPTPGSCSSLGTVPAVPKLRSASISRRA